MNRQVLAAAAWILERSKAFSHQYIAAEDQSSHGPSVVVNVGQVIINGEAKSSLPVRAEIVEAEILGGESADLGADIHSPTTTR